MTTQLAETCNSLLPGEVVEQAGRCFITYCGVPTTWAEDSYCAINKSTQQLEFDVLRKCLSGGRTGPVQGLDDQMDARQTDVLTDCTVCFLLHQEIVIPAV